MNRKFNRLIKSELKNEKEIRKEIKEQVKENIEKPYFNFRDVFELTEEEKVRKEYEKVKDDYTSFKDFCKKNGYAEFDINKRNFTNEYVVNRFLDENNLEISEKPIEARFIKKAYKYEELSGKAQDTAIRNVYNFVDGETYNDMFQEICNDRFNSLFSNSNVKYCYSLSYSQGDGFGLYGDLSFEDIETLTGESLSELEKDMINCGTYIESNYDVPILNNRQSTFWNDDMVELAYEDDMDYLLDYDPYFDYTEEEVNDAAKHIKTVEEKLKKRLSEICDQFEEDGYNFLYDDKMYLEDFYDMGYEFDEDGDIIESE